VYILTKVVEKEKVVEVTGSLCPECLKIIPAKLVERDGKIWMIKKCPEHGEFEELYWGDAELYYKAMKYTVPRRKITNPNVKEVTTCPFSCGLCPLHGNQTALANIVATNRCDLSCWYCFFFAERAGFVYEPSLEQIRKMVRILRQQGPWKPNAVQITGGEPLLRDDLVEIIKILREEGIVHVQLNTNGLRIFRMWENQGADAAVNYVRKLRTAGVNTVYLSFDAVSPKNFKNHWEIPFILEAFRRAGMTSTVFVPTVIRGFNDDQLGDIIDCAVRNIDVVRGVNFQPVSITGSVPRKERQKLRITTPDVIKLIEKQTDGQIGKEAWRPITWPYPLSWLIEELTGKPQFNLTNVPVCGMATYVFPKLRKVHGRIEVEGYIPITDFVDVDALWDWLMEKAQEIHNAKGVGKVFKKIKIALYLLIKGLDRFIDPSKEPEGLNLRKIIKKIIRKRSYSALGEFHYKALFLGIMHFMDLYNYDIRRVQRCCIHYLTPDGRIIPFCAFNVLNEIYRDKLQKEYSIPLSEWKKPFEKHKRDVNKIVKTELYQRFYEPYFNKYEDFKSSKS